MDCLLFGKRNTVTIYELEIAFEREIYIMEDEKTHRLMATAKVERYQKNDGRQRVLDFAEVLLRQILIQSDLICHVHSPNVQP